MSKHTPGPWKATDRTFCYGEIPVEADIGEGNFEICRVYPMANTKAMDCPTSAANARLISAAPELLELCQKILIALRYDRLKNPLSESLQGSVEMIEAVIERATGVPSR